MSLPLSGSALLTWPDGRTARLFCHGDSTFGWESEDETLLDVLTDITDPMAHDTVDSLARRVAAHFILPPGARVSDLRQDEWTAAEALPEGAVD